MTLAEPEDRLLAKVAVRIVRGDVHQLVRAGRGGRQGGAGLEGHPLAVLHDLVHELQGGAAGEGLYWATSTLLGTVGSHIIAIFLFLAGVLLLTGASVAGVLKATGAHVVGATLTKASTEAGYGYGRYGYGYGYHAVDKKRTEILMIPQGTES